MWPGSSTPFVRFYIGILQALCTHYNGKILIQHTLRKKRKRLPHCRIFHSKQISLLKQIPGAGTLKLAGKLKSNQILSSGIWNQRMSSFSFRFQPTIRGWAEGSNRIAPISTTAHSRNCGQTAVYESNQTFYFRWLDSKSTVWTHKS